VKSPLQPAYACIRAAGATGLRGSRDRAAESRPRQLPPHPRFATSDEALLAGLAAGDREAAAAFVRRFERRAYGLALTILGDRGAAEEATQEAFVRAWRHAETYDPRRGAVATWVLAIVRNVAIDALRLKRTEPSDPELLASRLQLATARDAHDEESLLVERERLREGLAALPLEQRRAIVLAVYFGRTAREIGELEGVPIGTAKTRIRTALLKLRELLAVSPER
jgi:RNA polymerase sigma factor (sigma-70 family)